MQTTYHIAVLATALLASCTSVLEKMDKGTPTGDHYLYHLGQIGGQVVATNSMGTSTTADNVKSFGDFITGLVAKWGFNASTQQMALKEGTKRYNMGQLTLQQKQKFDSAIIAAKDAGTLQYNLASLAAGKK